MKFKVGDKVKRKYGAPPHGRVEPGESYVIERFQASGSLVLNGEHDGYTYDPTCFEHFYLGSAVIRKTRNGGFRVNLTGKNGEKMYTSEVYATKGNAVRSAKLMKDFEIIDKTK